MSAAQTLLQAHPDATAIYAHNDEMALGAIAALEAAGARVAAADGLLSALTLLLRSDITTLLVEGGAALHGALLDAGLVDRVHLIVTPQTLGSGVKLFGGHRFGLSALEHMTVELRGTDTWIEADVHRHRRAGRETR